MLLFMWIIKLVGTQNVKDKDQCELGKFVPHIMYVLVILLVFTYYVPSCHRVFIPQSSMMTNMVYILPEFVEGVEDSSV